MVIFKATIYVGYPDIHTTFQLHTQPGLPDYSCDNTQKGKNTYTNMTTK
jgi:hypothetical protein